MSVVRTLTLHGAHYVHISMNVRKLDLFLIFTLLLRNKFHFYEVHGRMNAKDNVQSKGVKLTLHGTRYVHTSMNLRKMEFIFYIYTLFLHRFCSFFVEF